MIFFIIIWFGILVGLKTPQLIIVFSYNGKLLLGLAKFWRLYVLIFSNMLNYIRLKKLILTKF